MIQVNLGEEKTKNELGFPKLMINSDNNVIVYFIAPKTGMVIWDSKDIVGQYAENFWDMSAFSDYNKPVTLQNILS